MIGLRAAALIIASTLVACASLEGLFNREGPQPERPGTRVMGSHATVAGLAMVDFLGLSPLATQDASDAGVNLPTEPDALDGGQSDAGLTAVDAINACFARPEAYSTWVEYEAVREIYRVTILPRPDACTPAGTFTFGGGATYEIDARTLTLISKDLIE